MKSESTSSSPSRALVCLLTGLATGLLGTSVPAAADDTSVFANQLANQQKPNVLFVLDYSGSMLNGIGGGLVQPGETSKIATLKSAVNALLDENQDKINAGLGSLFNGNAGGVRWPISDLNANAHDIDPAIPEARNLTSRDIIEMQLERMNAGGGTATVNALVDAALYFKGGRVAHDDRATNQPDLHRPDRWNGTRDGYGGGVANAALPASYTPSDAYRVNAGVPDQIGYCSDYSPGGGVNYCAGRTTLDCEAIDARASTVSRPANLGDGRYNNCTYRHPDQWRGATYKAPVTQMCQSNYIILISDGQPTVRKNGPALQEALGGSADGCEDLSSSIFNRALGSSTFGNCGPEIVSKLAGVDEPMAAGRPDTRVTTYTIGFSVAGPGQNYLRKLAASSGTDANNRPNGKFINAANQAELETAITGVLDEITEGSENFSELSVDVNRATFSNDDRAYLNLFSPSIRRSWAGNLKGFFVKPEGLYDTNENPALIQVPAADTGGDESAPPSSEQAAFFATGMQSFWSSSPDGDQVARGGANEFVTSGGNRNLYTFLGTDIPSGGARLNRDANRLVATNNALRAPVFGLPEGSADRDALLGWLATSPMGAPLHSKPVRVEYEVTAGAGNQAGATTRQVMYTMTNQGFLHAFDATRPASGTFNDHGGGEELFAFMPAELLPNLPEIRREVTPGSNLTRGGHIYGLDGAITRWHDDANRDGKVNGQDKVMLILGMRRGGSSYYAIDVTNPERPKYMWRIAGGSTDFPDLAQTWSRASLITVKSGTGSKRVLAFGGGYDARTLDGTTRRKASRGNAIYLVDRDGQKLWGTSDSPDAAMQYAIPSDLTPIDSDSDGLADRLYVGDTGGQVWRVDFDDVNEESSFRVSRIADLDNGSHQPFFYPPNVAFNRGPAGDFLSITLGSGDRTQPLLPETRNAFYMLRDTDTAKGTPANASLIQFSDLYDATDNDIASDDTAKASRAAASLAEKRGWRVMLASGEKAITQLVTFEGQLLATTFESNVAPGGSSCGFEPLRRFYRMGLEDGRPLLANPSTDDQKSFTRHEIVAGRGIASSPVVAFTPGTSSATVLVDNRVVSLFEQKLRRVYWHSQ